MKTFKKHLEKELKDNNFKKKYEEENELLEISLKILEERNKLGLTQKELAAKANITQQQLSKVENGINCNMATFLKVCNALDIKLGLKKARV
ncbi:MAG: XRE family transcriptional regulator [Spirochaetae bacterium HGW-Spirochaetae-1]|jgi:DNA-binding XRE family transcriptional regulator|nr:MAG: XRE family transcriptional regulator [Spirochaetae bacterium HGW-Spirochaetae-1]